MSWFEDKLSPPNLRGQWVRDVLGMGLVLALAVPLVSALRWADSGQYLSDVAGQMASYGLLLAMGFLLALRCGAIDLSVWSSAGLGGLVAAFQPGDSPLGSVAWRPSPSSSSCRPP